MAKLNVINFPDRDVEDIPRMLRVIADEIESKQFGDAHNLAWVIDCGDGRLEIGLMGAAPEAGVTAYYLYGKAMRKLETI